MVVTHISVNFPVNLPVDRPEVLPYNSVRELSFRM